MSCFGVSLDFDDVLYNLTKINVDYVEKTYGVKLNPLEIDRFSYYIDEGYESIIENVWNNPEAYLKSELYDGAFEFYSKLKELLTIDKIQIVTTSLPDIIQNKNIFIKEKLNIDCNVIHSKNKFEFTKNTILVDDSINNIVKHVEINNDPAIIFNLGYGWNKSLKEDNQKIFRGNSYNETLYTIKNLLSIS